MEPILQNIQEILIAGVAGDGNLTAKLWEILMVKDQRTPLPNKTGDEAYEVRTYLGAKCDCFVGMPVKDWSVPSDFSIYRIPKGIYAVFTLYPIRGWPANNAAMDEWLDRNKDRYTQAVDETSGGLVSIQHYDQRFQGMNAPESILEMLIPLVPLV